MDEARVSMIENCSCLCHSSGRSASAQTNGQSELGTGKKSLHSEVKLKEQGALARLDEDNQESENACHTGKCLSLDKFVNLSGTQLVSLPP